MPAKGFRGNKKSFCSNGMRLTTEVIMLFLARVVKIRNL